MQLSTRSISLRSLIAGITVIGVISIALVIYSQYLTQQDLESNTRRTQLNQYVQQEIATAHLWFEEALGGDPSIDVERDVRDRVRICLLYTSDAADEYPRGGWAGGGGG